jgi:hypothetical protein
MAFQWLRCAAVRNESISFSEILKAPQKEYLELKQKSMIWISRKKSLYMTSKMTRAGRLLNI